MCCVHQRTISQRPDCRPLFLQTNASTLRNQALQTNQKIPVPANQLPQTLRRLIDKAAAASPTSTTEIQAAIQPKPHARNPGLIASRA